MTRARLRVGTTLAGKYQLEAVLGVGGMAAVYAASHRNGRRVAVKMLHPELSIRADIRQRFVREGQAANAVAHQGVVAVVDDDVAEDGAFLVMELLSGESVEELWERRGPHLDPRIVLAITYELCSVLAAAHRAGIIHRDIKPANLFVTSDGQLKVLDFGIARVRDIASTQLTNTGTTLGTPAFMGPEQAAGLASQVDERTDIWAVGATMFMLLTGELVHRGETPQHVAMLAATKPARSVRSVAPDVPPELATVVDRALVFDKEGRWPSAEALREALGEVSLALFGAESLPLPKHEDCAEPTIRDDDRPSAADSAQGKSFSRADTAIRVIGSTTSPVSSAAPTEKDQRTPVWSRPGRSISKTVASAYANFRIVVARTFGGRPVSGTAATERHALSKPPPRRRGFGVLMLASLVVGVPAAVGVVVISRHASAPADAAADRASSAGVVATSQELEPRAFASVAPPAPARVADSVANATPTRPASNPLPKPAVRAGTRPSAPMKKPAVVGTRESATPTPAAPPRSDCNPPYVIDSNGKTVWKKECL